MSFEKETGRDLYFAQLEKELAELIDDDTGLLDTRYVKKVKCPVCNQNEEETLFIKRGYTFVRCISCGMVYTNPQVNQEIVQGRYQNGSPSTELWMDVLMNSKETAWRSGYYQDILNEIEHQVEIKGNILDIGCAVGHFLDMARKTGWNVTGLELSPKGYEYCKELELNVLNTTIEDSGLPHESFDAITLIGVLEHVTDPEEVLKSCMKLLKKDGVILVVVPNMYSILNMLIQEESVTFDGRNHMLYFSEDTLKYLFDKVTLDVVLSDTLLTGIPNIKKYLQYNSPYVDDNSDRYLPPKLKNYFNNNQDQKELENWILNMNLGLRLRLIGKK